MGDDVNGIWGGKGTSELGEEFTGGSKREVERR